MTEKEKMLAGQLYNAAHDEETDKEHMYYYDLCHEFNHCRPSDREKQTEILNKIIGKHGKYMMAFGPIEIDLGYNVEVGEYFFMTRYGKVPPSDIDFKAASENANIYLIFGKESTGIPGEILRANLDRCFRIPMAADCRCLNVSNACAVAIYEVLRQLNYPGLSFTEEQKGEDFLEENYSYDETLRRKHK